MTEKRLLLRTNKKRDLNPDCITALGFLFFRSGYDSVVSWAHGESEENAPGKLKTNGYRHRSGGRARASVDAQSRL